LTGARVTSSVVGEVSASEAAVEVGREGVGTGPGTEEGRVGGAPATEAMDVNTTG
jgi:hypothetical protein